ncbi:hypothetical protein [Gemmata sp. SH-PL17]|uniref:hypothetical protein n=1 Tax=Gemmata sp. SH-PL17 TaxID=1630693 RepID=UPI0004BCCEC9|nr:hypothetical protein [Gemmata sp. SH-PL17]
MELDREQERVGEAPEGAEEADPRVVRGRAPGYLRNNAERMKYPGYRKARLPVTRSWVESRFKKINYRVKDTETFWNEHGAGRKRAGRPSGRAQRRRTAHQGPRQRPGCPFQRRTTVA